MPPMTISREPWASLWRSDFWTKGNEEYAIQADWKYVEMRKVAKEMVETLGNCDHTTPLPMYAGLDASCLSNEIWLLILHNLTLRQLSGAPCRLSWRFHHLCMTIVFRDVDASLHHYRIPDGCASANFDWIHWDCGVVADRQIRVLKQVRQSPRYASYVRTFIWTMRFAPSESEVSCCDTLVQVSSHIHLFDLLKNVTSVDIDTGFMRVPPVHHSMNLFPKASKVQLGGVMPYSLAAAILHGNDKAPLRSLILFNVIEVGKVDIDGHDNDVPVRKFGQVRYIDPADIQEDWPSGVTPVRVRPGCMRRLLTTELQRRCQSLVYLLLRKQGQQHSQQLLPSEITFDEEVYEEWAEFIEATKPQHLRLEHGGTTEPPVTGRHKDLWALPSWLTREAVSPMDLRFQKWLSPVLSCG
ncbi:hypothetical protein K491DRAFT_721589 [Lophiostoma macrostomum CBS 122681]|uniref:F-box domain-containing protein n=1 Tax=Lophiostoma macrostomum CBS 122681 TaxID=1314788 RepID=A0A6A6ST00_9PLEO|nr:hypothetical protein K491DRAFT_721589 [Lophiostoma macrostomum CBS 122681]